MLVRFVRLSRLASLCAGLRLLLNERRRWRAHKPLAGGWLSSGGLKTLLPLPLYVCILCTKCKVTSIRSNDDGLGEYKDAMTVSISPRVGHQTRQGERESSRKVNR